MDWQNKKVLVVGLGGTGVSMIAFLRQQGAQVAARRMERPLLHDH